MGGGLLVGVGMGWARFLLGGRRGGGDGGVGEGKGDEREEETSRIRRKKRVHGADME